MPHAVVNSQLPVQFDIIIHKCLVSHPVHLSVSLRICKMSMDDSTRLSHKNWRRIAKKERRKHLRCEAARKRDAEEDQLRAALERSAEYLSWCEEQERQDEEKEAQEHKEHAEKERLWLEEEVKAQVEWQVLQERKTKAKEQYMEQQTKILEEFKAKQEAIQKKKEEEKRKYEEQVERHEQLQKEINDYIDNGMKTPEALREIIDSQPSKDLCSFFTKTSACRYGDACSKNHRRVFLSKVILIPGFYSHFSLEKNSAEYDTDVALEFENSETQRHFREFYNDVLSELESFGKIKTLKCCCNTEIHLRGNLYVEYYTEREAARAWKNLKGRWYAGKQLNCEFANLKSWRSAICGMAKCPKGRTCNFLHVFKNPHGEYDTRGQVRQKMKDILQDSSNSKRREYKSESKWEESVSDNEETNSRWSNSPEIGDIMERNWDELEHCMKNNEKKRSKGHSTERSYSPRNGKHKCSERSSKKRLRTSRSISPKNSRSSHRKNQQKATSDEYSPKKHKKKSKKRKQE